MRKSSMVLGLVMLAVCLNSPVFAEESMSESSSAEEKQAKFCVICGPSEKMEGDAKYKHEFDGETYNFCSKACLDKFKEDPEKYIKMMEENNYSENVHEDSKEESHEGHDHGKEGEHNKDNHNEEGHEGHDHK